MMFHHFPLCTLWLFHITMANGPLIDDQHDDLTYDLPIKNRVFIDFSIFPIRQVQQPEGTSPIEKSPGHRQGRRRCIEDVVAARRCHRSVGPDAGGPHAARGRGGQAKRGIARDGQVDGPHLAGG